MEEHKTAADPVQLRKRIYHVYFSHFISSLMRNNFLVYKWYHRPLIYMYSMALWFLVLQACKRFTELEQIFLAVELTSHGQDHGERGERVHPLLLSLL